MLKKCFLLLLIVGFLFSCAEKKAVTTQEMPPEEPPVEEVVLPEEPEIEEPIEVAKAGVSMEEILQDDIHFDFDRYEIKSDDKPTLKGMADWLIDNSDVSIRIEGHCDERGTNEYNLGLGDRRANATKSYLMMLGVPSSRLETVSYGEERPLCRVNLENCWWRNRRAHFTPAD